MLDTKNFIDNLKAQAHLKAQEIIDMANVVRDDAFKMQENEHAEALAKNARAIDDASKQSFSRHSIIAKKEATNIIANAKHIALASIYDLAKQYFISLNDTKYKEFIERLIMAHANNGDTVVIAEKDTKRITTDFIDTCATKARIKLILSIDTHPFDGGIFLQGSKYDKNLTLNALINAVKEDTEAEITKILFG